MPSLSPGQPCNNEVLSHQCGAPHDPFRHLHISKEVEYCETTLSHLKIWRPPWPSGKSNKDSHPYALLKWINCRAYNRKGSEKKKQSVRGFTENGSVWIPSWSFKPPCLFTGAECCCLKSGHIVVTSVWIKFLPTFHGFFFNFRWDRGRAALPQGQLLNMFLTSEMLPPMWRGEFHPLLNIHATARVCDSSYY